MEKNYLNNLKEVLGYAITEAPVFKKPNIVKSNDRKRKCVFRTILQDFDVENRNGRIYPQNVMAEALKDVEEDMRNRCWLGELDHPDDETSDERKATVTYANASHIILDYEIKDGILYGELETTSTQSGLNLYGLISDGVKVGFSARCFGNVESAGKFVKLVPPVILITYDAVSLPSHKKARMTEIRLLEAVNVLQNAYNNKSNVAIYENQLYSVELLERYIMMSAKKYDRFII